MPQRLAGQLVDGGDPVTDEPVFVVDTAPADESNWSIVATDRSAADGSWSVTVPNADAERYHAVAQFEESGTLKNALSKPFLTSQPFVQTGAVTVGFDVLTPSTIGSAIPDSAALRQPWDEGSGLTAQDVIGDNDGTLSEPDWITNSDFEGGVGLSFDGNGDSVQIDNLPYLMDDDVLASITVNFNNVDSNQIIANLAPTPLIDGAFAFGISRDTNGAFAFRDFRNGGSTDNSQSEDGVFSPNTNYRVSVLIPANTSGYRAWVNNQELSLPEGEDISLARDESHFGGGFSPETLDGTGDHPILYQAPTDIEDTVAKDYEAQVWS